MEKRKGFGRPTRSMQEAVNLALEGKAKEAKAKLAEDDRNTTEAFAHFSELRRIAGAYELSRRPRGLSKSDGEARFGHIEITIDRRTSVRQLFLLIDRAEQVRAKAQRELKRRPERQVEPVRKRMGEIALLRKKRAEIDYKIKEAEEAFGS